MDKRRGRTPVAQHVDGATTLWGVRSTVLLAGTVTGTPRQFTIAALRAVLMTTMVEGLSREKIVLNWKGEQTVTRFDVIDLLRLCHRWAQAGVADHLFFLAYNEIPYTLEQYYLLYVELADGTCQVWISDTMEVG
jgi:hypothetical protein